MSDDLYNHPGWEDCTFEGARRQVLRNGLRTTFREKLIAIEEAGKLAEKFRRNRLEQSKARSGSIGFKG